MKYSSIFKRYMENRASPEEVATLRSWLNKVTDDDRELQQFIELEWEKFIKTDNDSLPEMDQILSTINRKIDKNEFAALDARTIGERRFSKRRHVYFGMAAVFLIIISLSVLLIPKKPADVKDAFITEIKSNPRGQKSSLVLIDGTRVKLNSESEISFPEKFEKNKRVVFLKGEAFFEVAKDASRPFTVVTDNVTTTALGTSFNIKAFKNQKDIQITLATGKVKISDLTDKNSNQLYLTPNHRATFDKELATFKKDSLDISENIAWKDGILTFRNASLADIKEKIERWYNVHIEVTNDKRWGHRSFTGIFDNETLENVLNGMSYSSQFKYSIDGREVKIVL